MAEFENCIGETDEWYTPPELLEALGCSYDLDPCSPGEGHWVPARSVYTKNDHDSIKRFLKTGKIKSCLIFGQPAEQFVEAYVAEYL
jgi:hypothetical protein